MSNQDKPSQPTGSPNSSDTTATKVPPPAPSGSDIGTATKSRVPVTPPSPKVTTKRG